MEYKYRKAEHDYRMLFKDAIVRSNYFSLDPPNEDFQKIMENKTSFITPEIQTDLYMGLFRGLEDKQPKDLVGECANCTLAAKPFVDRFFNTTSFITIGGLTDEEHGGYNLTEVDIKKFFVAGGNKSNETMNYHVWITLPSFEIIDFTHWVTKQHVMGKLASDFRAYTGTPANMLFNKLVYTPMLIGEGPLDKLFKLV